MLKSKEKEIILGIDPGLANTGFGVIVRKNKNIKILTCGCISTSPRTETGERLYKIQKELKKLIKKFKPDILATEEIFFAKNAKTALKVGEARGVILLIAHSANIPIKEFTPLQVKQAITGYGRAEKKQMQKMIKILLNLEEIPEPDDAADALAIALCCTQTKNFN